MTTTLRQLFGLVLSLFLLSCGHPTKVPVSGARLQRGLSGEPSSLDPAIASDNFSFEVLRDLYEGLTTETRDGEIVPGVASSWTIDPSGKEYTFQLRSNANWSNGQPVRAQDFVAAWRRVVDPKQASPVANDLRLIAKASEVIRGSAPPSALGVFAPTDHVLIVKLEQPAPYFPELLTHAAAYPIFSTNSAGGKDPKSWISNGPYVLSAWSPGTTVGLVKNPQYWDSANVQVSRVEYQIADENSQYARYRAGQLDLTDSVPANAIPKIRAARPSELVVAPFLATSYYSLNLSVRPLEANAALRQAMTMAIDRKQLVGALGFGQKPAYGFVPPHTWNYTPQSWAWEAMNDIDRGLEAKRLYAQAGYSAKVPLHLRLLFNSDPVIRNTAIIVAAMWKENLGIETTLVEEEYRVFLESRHDKSKWEVARLGWTADYNDASNFLDIFRERSANNDSGYKSSKFDDLLDTAAATPNPERRRAILEASERAMLADYPVIPLYFFVSKRLVKPYVEGFTPNPLNKVESKHLKILPHGT